MNPTLLDHNTVLTTALPLLQTDFARKVLAGSAVLTVVTCLEGARELALDARDLAIAGVSLAADATPLTFRVEERKANFGQAIFVTLPEASSKLFVQEELIAIESDPHSCEPESNSLSNFTVCNGLVTRPRRMEQ